MIQWRRLADLPLLVILMGLTSAAMVLPAGYALALRELPISRAFLYSGLILLFLTALIALATATLRPRDLIQGQLVAIVAAYLVLPAIAAIPVHQSIPGLSFADAWFEMLSCFTTTGATVFDAPVDVAAPLHFWRALVGWLGGFFILLSVAAVLFPLGLGGAELSMAQSQGSAAGRRQKSHIAEPSLRIVRMAGMFFPPYAALTAVLWFGLVLAGDTALVSLVHAMGAISTSGISSLAGLQNAASGVIGEAMIFAVLCLAVSRRLWPPVISADRFDDFWKDPEVQLGLMVLVAAVAVLALQQSVMPSATGAVTGISDVILSVWAAMFTALSFMTTTGFISASWPEADPPLLVLMGLAIMGGGVATTAGGVKLLRVYALLRHGERELERIVHPHSIGGHGPVARRLRREGAYLAWIFFMIFGLLLVIVITALTLTGLDFKAALILSVASITTTGQLASVATDGTMGYSNIDTTAKAILGVAMILGRLEVLAIFAVVAPNRWGR